MAGMNNPAATTLNRQVSSETAYYLHGHGADDGGGGVGGSLAAPTRMHRSVSRWHSQSPSI
jgi:hypothetical protein